MLGIDVKVGDMTNEEILTSTEVMFNLLQEY